LTAYNAIFYLLRAGCAWRLLSHEFPRWQTVYDYFSKWRKDELCDDIHKALREQTKVRAGRDATSSATVIFSQSLKSTEKDGPQRGYDDGKKVNGRKRHILVDTTGLLLKPRVHAADITDSDGANYCSNQ
jgi:putative transposase